MARAAAPWMVRVVGPYHATCNQHGSRPPRSRCRQPCAISGPRYRAPGLAAGLRQCQHGTREPASPTTADTRKWPTYSHASRRVRRCTSSVCSTRCLAGCGRHPPRLSATSWSSAGLDGPPSRTAGEAPRGAWGGRRSWCCNCARALFPFVPRIHPAAACSFTSCCSSCKNSVKSVKWKKSGSPQMREVDRDVVLMTQFAGALHAVAADSVAHALLATLSPLVSALPPCSPCSCSLSQRRPQALQCTPLLSGARRLHTSRVPRSSAAVAGCVALGRGCCVWLNCIAFARVGSPAVTAFKCQPWQRNAGVRRCRRCCERRRSCPKRWRRLAFRGQR